MVALVVDVFLGVFSRYVLHATFRWYDEVARLCFVWIIFLGAAVAVRRRLHFRMHLVVDRFGRRRRRRDWPGLVPGGHRLRRGARGGRHRDGPIAHRQVTTRSRSPSSGSSAPCPSAAP